RRGAGVAPGRGPGGGRALAGELDARLQVPDAAGVKNRIRGLKPHGELGALEHAARESRRKRALLEWNLFACEEDVARRRTRLRELEHHGDATLHVARAEPVYNAIGDPARQVLLRGHRVEVTGKGDRRRGVTPDDRLAVVVKGFARQKTPHELHRDAFATTLRGNVDELERSGGEIGSGHGRSHNDRRMATRQPDRSWAAEP